MTSEELDAMAKKLKPLIYPPYIWFAEVNGTPAGVHLALPDYNDSLARQGSYCNRAWILTKELTMMSAVFACLNNRPLTQGSSLIA
jgi:hypothetical protein